MTENHELKHHQPAGLGTRAQELWISVTSTYRLRPDELVLLEEACREVDLIERIDARLRLGTITARGAWGAVAAHPLLAEIRQHRGVLARLLASLKLADVANQRPADSPSTKARRAANTRWGQR